MKYVKCIANNVECACKGIYYENITINKIYEAIEKYDLSDTVYHIKNDAGMIFLYNKKLFVDVTRELKLKRVLKNEI